MKKIIVILLSMSLLWGCSQQSNTLKIGVILPLTGNASFVGSPMKKAISLRIKEYNKSHKKKIELQFEDSQGLPKVGLSSFEKLKSDGIKVIIGPASSSVTLAIAPKANESKIVILSPSASAPAITDAGEYIFRNELSDLLGASKQAELTYDTLQIHNLSILYINNDYGVGVYNAFKKKFEELGGNISNSLSYSDASTDFKTQIAKIASDKSNAVFIIAQNEYSNIIRQFYELGVKKQILATPVFENQSFITSLGQISNNIIYSYYGSFGSHKNKIQTNFINSFKTEYNKEPNYYAALAYESASIIIYGLQKANFEMDKLYKTLLEVKDFPSVTGNLSFDKNGDVDKPVVLKTVKNENFQPY